MGNLLISINIIAIRCQILITKCTKIEIDWGFAPDPTGGAYDAPPDPLVGWGGGHPLPIRQPLGTFGTFGASTLETRDPFAFGARSVCSKIFSLF